MTEIWAAAQAAAYSARGSPCRCARERTAQRQVRRKAEIAPGKPNLHPHLGFPAPAQLRPSLPGALPRISGPRSAKRLVTAHGLQPAECGRGSAVGVEGRGLRRPPISVQEIKGGGEPWGRTAAAEEVGWAETWGARADGATATDFGRV